MQNEGKRKSRINVRRADVLDRIQEEVRTHYKSALVDAIRQAGGRLSLPHTQIVLAQEFGFCRGVQRAIDMAYAARTVFPNEKIYLIGEIIHNPEVNRRLDQMGVMHLPWKTLNEEYEQLQEGDVVIVPAFGVPTEYMDFLENKGVAIVDTTCGDVMKVWRRVKDYAQQGITSIIHGKATHEETSATASRALGENSQGKYLVVYSNDDAQFLANYIANGGDSAEFLAHFKGAIPEGFNPDTDLIRVGLANQTTMLKGETEMIQEEIRQAIIKRDGDDANYHAFDTICGATQDRQNALFHLLEQSPDIMFVVGGYNSSNTTHLVDIAKEKVPTFFIESAACIHSLDHVECFDTKLRQVIQTSFPDSVLDLERPLVVGITAGASCPGNLIEETIFRFGQLRQDTMSDILSAAQLN